MATQYQDKAPILITGGTGFIGSYLAMHLMEEGERVVLFDRNPDLRRITGFGGRYEKVKDQLVAFVQGDLTLLPHVLALFDVHEPKGVFHLGALLATGAEANPTMGFQVDLVGTWNVLEAARLYCQHKKSPPVKVLFPSSIATFGYFIKEGETVPNEAVQVPTGMYGVAKVASERLGEYYHRKGWVNFRAVRFPAVIGASRGPGAVTAYSSLMIQEPLQGKPYEVYVDKETPLDILYVKDAIRALTDLYAADEAKLTTPGRRVYNIAGIRINGQAPKASDIEAAVTRFRPDARITYNPRKQQTDTIRSFGVLDDSIARKEWGWAGASFDLDKVVKAFDKDISDYPDRILPIELVG